MAPVVKTHTFNGTPYLIEQVQRIDGVTDTGDVPDPPLEMLILRGDNITALHSALHEGMEAIGACDKCVHDYDSRDDGRPKTWDVARFLWRLGWRKVK
ncbi:hypothetical protein LCGC14_2885750 [marine sediment metagenome]|uniref:Uncharacterized protein n=1 Tax=marine sediment metagenome TaxID=412755 RepID=A0A0F8YKI0_9ZZZZ